MGKRIRRTKEEIEAGITVAQKKDMIEKSLIEKRAAGKKGKAQPNTSTVYEQYDPDTKTVYKYNMHSYAMLCDDCSS